MDEPSPSRNVTFQIQILSGDELSPALALVFTQAVAEAQLLEEALKSVIKMDVDAFAAADAPDLLAALAKITLGGTLKIADGTAARSPAQKAMADLVGFSQLFLAVSGLTKTRLDAKFSDALVRRNTIAHHLLSDLIRGLRKETDVVEYLAIAKSLFGELKQVVIKADFISSKSGAVASDGATLARIPKL